MSVSVLFAASECVPFVKTGGLADVAGALPKTLRENGTDIRVVMPLYGSIKGKYAPYLRHICDFNVKLGWRNQYCGVESMKLEGLTYYFIDNEYYFARDYIYGVFSCDEAERFGFFSKAILELMAHTGFFPDILHLNDWQTGMAAALKCEQYSADPRYARVKTVFTVHNLRFQGVFERAFTDELLSLGKCAFDPDRLEYNGCVNYLKGGLVYADRITTVSPTYASEIKTRFYGESLDGVLRSRGEALSGILNGIDCEEYDPGRDRLIAANYSALDFSNKAECKKALIQELGFEGDGRAPIIGIVSRLTDQKGMSLVERVLGEIMEKDVRLAVLGTGEARFEGLFRWAQWRWKGRAAARIEYSDALAHRIYAGSDMLIMPSLFEPCGLSQMIAMRYGTIPVVRETGGLRDSVECYNKFEDTGVGFSFMNYNAHELLYTVQHAVDYYRDDPEMWRRLVGRAMKKDFSWTVSAAEYGALYEAML